MTRIHPHRLALTLAALIVVLAASSLYARPPLRESADPALVPQPAATPTGPAAPTAGPDLVVTLIDAPPSLMILEDFTSRLVIVVQNIGDTATPTNFRLRALFSTDLEFANTGDAVIFTQFNIGPLGPGQSVQVNIPTAVVPPQTTLGSQFLLVKVDSNPDITETDETNNVGSFPVTILDNPTVRCVYFEDFQGADGGWTPSDLLGGGGPYWHHDQGTMWCGTTEGLTTPPGYGNGWIQYLTKSFTVLPGAGVSFDIQYETEPTYDYVHLDVSTDQVNYTTIWSIDGNSGGFVFRNFDLSAWAGQTVQLRFRFTSDGGWSDEDGIFPTANGAVRIDNVTVFGHPTDRFDTGADGWVASVPAKSGALLRLEEEAYCPPEAGELCHTYSTGVAVDPCWQWVIYDPFTLQYPISAAGAGNEANYAITSPVIPLPADATTYYLRLDAFYQMPLSSGIFYTFDVAIPADSPWKSYAFIVYSNAFTRARPNYDITNLVTTPGATTGRIRIRTLEVINQCGPDALCGPVTGPYFDNVQLIVGGGSQAGAIDCTVYPRDCNTVAGDFDGDGVDDGVDLEPTVSSAPFDRNGDGVLDEIRGGRHVEYFGDGDFPLSYAIHEGGAPGISQAGTVDAIQGAMGAWESVADADVSFNYLGITSQAIANGMDGMNLVTFADDEFRFPAGVLAVGISTSFTAPTMFMGTTYRPGQIADVDMIFNPDQGFRTDTEGPPGGSDIRSVATHEAGHLIGLSHSAVATSTMFFVLPPGTDAASLEPDDELTARKAYYSAGALPGLSRLEGIITNGYTGNPVPGAIVFAINAATDDTTGCEYTLQNGSYQFVGLPAGNYYVAIHPLNKTSPIGYIGPENINEMIYGIALTTFVPEWWDAAEASTDDASERTAVAVTPGVTTADINLMTNVDLVAPTVMSVSPTAGGTGVVIDPAVLVAFSEAIDDGTLSGNFSLHDVATHTFVPGSAAMVDDGTTLAFVPSEPLAFSTQYEVTLAVGIEDLFGNGLPTPFSWQFTTEAQPPVAMTLLSPSKGGAGTVLAVSGFGFDPEPANNLVSVSGVPATVLSADPNQLAVRLPATMAEGGHPVMVTNLITSQTSNVLTFTVLQDEELPRGFDAGSATLAGTPRTLTVTNEGERAFVATDLGISTVAVDPGAPEYLATTDVPITGGINDLDLTPDGSLAYAISTDAAMVYRINANPAAGPIAVLNESVVDFVPKAIVIEPSGRRAFISTTDGRVRIWDTRPGSPTFDRDIGEMASAFTTFVGGIATDAAGNYLLALTGTGQMAVFNLDSNTYERAVPVGPRPRDVVVDPAGERAYVSDDNGTVTVVRLDTFEAVVDITAGGQLRGIVSSPSGAYAHAVDRALDYINVIDLRETSSRFRTVAVRIPQPRDPVDVALTPDGRYAFSLIESNRTLHVNAVGVGPTIVSVSPPRAPVGARVVIGGRNFVTNSVTSVSFGGFEVGPVHMSEHALEVVVPPGAVTGAVFVRGTTADGVPASSNDLTFALAGPSGDGDLYTLFSAPIPGMDVRSALTVSPGGNMLVVGGTGGELAVFDADPASDTFGSFITTIATAGTGLGEIRFTPDGIRAYVAAPAAGEVRGYDMNRHSPTFGQPIAVVALPATGADRLAISPDGNVLLAGNPVAATVDVIDIRSGSGTEHQVRQTVSTVDGALANNGAVGAMAFHPGGVHAYLAIQDDDPSAVSVLTVDTEAGSAVLAGSVPLGGTETPVSLSFTPDGSSCLVLTSALGGPPSRTVFTLDTSSPNSPAIAGSQVFPATEIASDEHIVVSPRGDRAMLNLRGDGFHHLDITARPVLGDLSVTGGPMHAAPLAHGYSPGGEFLYAASTASDALVVHDFVATARSMSLVSGDGQSSVIGNELPSPLRVRVTTDDGGVPGVPVTFSVTMDDGSFVTADPVATPATIIAATDAGGYAQVRFRAGTTVGTATQQVTASASGVAGSPVTFTATTLADPELIPLTLVSVSPVDGRTNVSTSTSVQAVFSRALNPATVLPGGFFLRDLTTSETVPALVGFGSGDTRASLTPISPLAPSRSYLLVVSQMQDMGGNTLALPTSASFTTAPPPALSLRSVQPPAAVDGVDVVLAGEGFAPTITGNTVLFAGVPALVRSLSGDAMVVQVPPGAISGMVTVQTAAGTSNSVFFEVLDPPSSPVDDVIGSIETGTSARSIAITPNGALAYAVSPDANLVVAVDLIRFRTMANINVDDSPYSVTVHPDGDFVYVANLGSGTVSVIDADPASADFNHVVESIAVGSGPVDVAVSPDGSRIIIVNAVSENLSIVDGDVASDTHHRVLATPPTSSSGRTVAISPDGGRWFIGNESGYIVMQPLGYAVIATAPTGSAARSVAITPDGTLLIVLTELGQLFAFDVTPGSPSANQVIATAPTGSGARSVGISPDGTFLYVIMEDFDDILVFSLRIPRGTSVFGPDYVGTPFTLTQVGTVNAGENPSHVAFDPSGSGLLLVTNEGDQSISALTSTPPVIEAEVTVTVDALGPGVNASIELSPAFPPGGIDVAGVTLSGSGSVPTLPQHTTIEDSDMDGVDELHVVFDRVQFQSVIPQGDAVTLTISGTAGPVSFSGQVVVTSFSPVITAPVSQALPPNADFMVQWTTPPAALADAVDVYWTDDDGASWMPIALNIPDAKQVLWHIPDVMNTQGRILVRLYRNGQPIGAGVSPLPFMIDRTIAVRLREFNGWVEKGVVRLQWSTATESDLAGFRVMRSTPAGLPRDVSGGVITPRGGGARYDFSDSDARPNVEYRYELLEVGSNGEESVLQEVRLTVRLAFSLQQNVPNPFNPTTTIAFVIPEDASVSLTIYDVAGRLVRTLVEERKRAAHYEVTWDGTDNRGVRAASGVYFYRLVADKHVQTRKMVLLK